ncbi:MAG: ABC transporter permease, partial [Woeseiaceae bacterium]
EPGRLVRVFETTPDGDTNPVSGGAFKDWKQHHSSFEHLAVYEDARMNLTGIDIPERLSGLRVSTEYLSALGISPLIGRDFAGGEDAVGGNNQVVLLSHRFWLDRFGGSRDVLGDVMLLDQLPYTIVGVLPPRALLEDEALFLVPNVIDSAQSSWAREGHWRAVIGRLRAGVTRSEARAELRTIKGRLNAEYPSFKQAWSVDIVPVREVYAGDIRPTLFVLFGTVAFVLLIACMNVSNLVLARANGRAREMAARAALGASSARILRQLLVESLLLAMLGCIAGLLLALFGIRLLSGMVADMLPHALQPELDYNVLAFSVVVSCGCGILFGILPALRASRPNLTSVMKEGERGAFSGERKRAQSALLGTQFAFTLVLLIGAGLLLRSFVLLLEADPGFKPEHALAFDLSFPETKYPDTESRLRVIDGLTTQIGALPGVEFAGVTSFVPLGYRDNNEMLSRADRPFSADYHVGVEAVSGDYLQAVGLELLQGRFIGPADNRTDAPRVLVINSEVAKDLYPEGDPVGQRLRLFDEFWEIVGVVAPVRHSAMHVDPGPRVYSAHAYASWSTSMVVRTSLPPVQLIADLRRAVLEIDPDQPIANVRTLEQAIHDSMANQRTTLTLLGLFAGIAVVLACVGIYVISYTIGQREREYGIRSALGASGHDIVRLVMEAGLKPSLLGMAAGLLGAFLLARFLESLLFEVKAHDPLVFVAAIFLLVFVAVLSILIPARRAARVEPMQALRQE